MPTDRRPAHRVYFSDLAGVVAGAGVRIEGDEADHAVRAKRVRPGDPVELFDGHGVSGDAEVLRAESRRRPHLELVVHGFRSVDPPDPCIEVWSPPPKGDRLETMIDQLSQLGVSSWRPLRTTRMERDTFRTERLVRVAVESAKQCGRAWLMRIGDWIGLSDALTDGRAIVADASGESVSPVRSDTVLLLGPEGGWTPEEYDAVVSAGLRMVRFGPHVMRIETAAVAGAACLLAHTDTLIKGEVP